MQDSLGQQEKRQIAKLDFISVLVSVCSLLWFICFELGTSHKLLRKLIAPKLGTAPHETLRACVQLTYSGAYPYS